MSTIPSPLKEGQAQDILMALNPQLTGTETIARLELLKRGDIPKIDVGYYSQIDLAPDGNGFTLSGPSNLETLELLEHCSPHKYIPDGDL